MRSRIDATAVAGAFVLAAAACSHDWDNLDPRLSGGGASGPNAGGNAGAGASSMGGAGAIGGGGAGAVGGSGTGGTGGGLGGSGGTLSDDGLVVRYYLDEASSGIAPMAALDAAPGALPLPIDYVGQMAYTNEDGHLGIHWPVAAEDGGPLLPISGTKVMGLDDSSTGTIEAVARVEQASISGSRLVHIGEETDWSFSLGVLLPQPEAGVVVGAPTRFVAQAAMTTGNFFAVGWEYAFDPAERFVVHTVFDSGQASPAERSKLYVNGVLLTPVSEPVFPELGDTISLLGGEAIGVGNRLIGGRSIRGTVFYGAYYSTAMSERTILEHVAILTANDDAP